MKLAAVLMVRNAEETLAQALDSVLGWCDDILALCAGPSEDSTEQILQDFDVLYERVEWEDNFALARNQLFAFARQHADWAVLLDADDVLTEGRALKNAVERIVREGAVGGYLRVNFGSLRYWQKRLFNLKHEGEWLARVHETYKLAGHWPQVPDCEIVHKRGAKQGLRAKDRNLRIFERWLEEAPEEFDAHTFYNYGNELLWRRMWRDAIRIYGLAQGLGQWRDERYFTHIKRGQCFVQVEAWPQAWMQFVEAAELIPEWRDAYLELSRWFYHRKLWDLCLAMNRFSLDKEPAKTILPVSQTNYTTEQDWYVREARKHSEGHEVG